MDFLHALQFSRYATRALAAHADDAAWLRGAVAAPFPWPEETAPVLAATAPEALAAHLRALRRRLMLHTMARDLGGRADLSEVCTAITRLAELAIREAVRVHHAVLADQHGRPCDGDGRPQELVVIGMGKLGGGELNVSSDVDLVFAYPAEGETEGPRTLSSREFFERLGRRLIGALQELTAEGYVFRVDMRLRPYGDSGPMAVPFSALEQYFITQGRAWERYAWLKARPLTGNADAALLEVVTPFVFRKYLDFDAYEGLRDIHRQIREQGRRRDYAGNVKLGPGGIREIEFTIQALQLVRGGREPALRVRGTLPALEVIRARGLLPEGAVTALREAYVFLRNLEHRLQYRDDQQTQSLPEAADERTALAAAMGYADVPAFDAELGRQRSEVETQFAAVFGEPLPATTGTTSLAGDTREDGFAAIWRDTVSADVALQTLGQGGFADAGALLGTLSRVRQSGRYLQLPALSQQRFDALVPRLLDAAATNAGRDCDAQTLFMRLLALLEAVSRRSAYLALLMEHPPLLPRLAGLMAASAWAAAYLTRHPILLDELLDARVLLAEVDWDAWRRELDRALADHDADAERAMDALRHFQHAQTFRLLAQDLAGMLTVERLADHLSALADIVLAATLRMVWKQVAGPTAPPPRFAIIGYGKLGGKELGYASDLDLVFLYDDAEDGALERYTRVARRLVTWLNSATSAGTLYETDLRLRPDGAAGLVTSSFAGFCRYQHEQAWTWEHQALTRARFVAGDVALGERFEAEREAILRLPRDPVRLRGEIADMRRRMLGGHPNPTPLFDVKHDPGGMVDVEFAVQYLVLAHAQRYPELTRNAGNIALLHAAARLGLVDSDTAIAAANAYRDYRRRQHQLRLTGMGEARVDPQEEAARRSAVSALWSAVFGAAWQ